jgi:hypothetical protein
VGADGEELSCAPAFPRDLAGYRRGCRTVVVDVADALRSSESETTRTKEASPIATASTTEEEASLSPWQEVEQAGNEWARLFAGDRGRVPPVLVST